MFAASGSIIMINKGSMAVLLNTLLRDAKISNLSNEPPEGRKTPSHRVGRERLRGIR